MTINKIIEYFNKRGLTWPSYQKALMFLVQEAIEALEDTKEMGDVFMMYTIAEYESNRNAKALMLDKFIKKTGNPIWNGEYRPNKFDYSNLDQSTVDVMRAIGHFVDAITTGNWVRNNPDKDRDIKNAADNLINEIIKFVEVKDGSR